MGFRFVLLTQAISLATATLTSAIPARGQSVLQSLSEDMREREYAEIRGKLLTAAEQMPADNYGFKAAPEIRSFGEELNHAADVNFQLCGLASPQANEDRGDRPNVNRRTAKVDIVARLLRSLELCDGALMQLTDEGAKQPTFGRYIRGSHVVAMLGHNWNVYGKLTIMMRLNGIAPAGRTP